MYANDTSYLFELKNTKFQCFPSQKMHQARPIQSASPVDSAYSSQSSSRSSPSPSQFNLFIFKTANTTADWYSRASSPVYSLDSVRSSPVQHITTVATLPLPRHMNVNAKPFVPRPVRKGKQHPLMPHSNVDALPFYPSRFLAEEERWNLHLPADDKKMFIFY
ncbi:unnamed protein product [Bursaphelenchus okinawaensis]|uniref:Uncharacterized protein n=1 Tax=Bursaphelenchus okinawaensis TaxID=465554 RepID=A0A811KE23_9BILA|nr:unnamed protein product [Bursaphelenchus okinawaensis]CAG9101882.1 unnamed protein product [Bursaphelenchus okinawaensis]